MTDIEARNEANHMRGTEFDTPSQNPNAPIRRGIITIDGCVIKMLVYPERIGAKGNLYNPIQLHYTPDCHRVLKAVKVDD